MIARKAPAPFPFNVYSPIKRAFDASVAAVALITTSPVLAVLALAVKLTSPGPVLYRGKRVGRYGRVFHLLKFRTMVANAEALGGSATANDDVRLTSFGRRIRRWKLDELPQLWNVLIGEMSFVGPRPEVEKYVALYGEAERRILELPPGLTDWATIWNSDEGAALAGHADAEKVYEEVIRPIKIELQLFYCDHHSFGADLRILWYTARKLLDRNWTPRELANYGSSLKMGKSCDRVRHSAESLQEQSNKQSA